MFWKKFKLKAAVLGIIGLIFIGLVIFRTPSQNFIVQVDEQGFSPATINLTQGDSITFVNSGKWYHWPASNIHPTHLIYPEFDPKRDLKAHEQWTFKFEKVGNWRFHDHDFPSNTGQVAVAKNNSPAYVLKNTLEPGLVALANVRFNLERLSYTLFPYMAQNKLNKSDIFNLVNNDLPQLKLLVAEVGSQKVLDKLLNQSNGGSTIDCHQPAHQIGRFSYEVYGHDAFKIVDQTCHSGYMHGAMEAFLKDKGTDDLAGKIDKLCNSFPNAFSNFECLHGVGHGVMAYEDYNMPQALTICHGLKDEFSQSSCYGGVFMENVVVAEGNGATPGHTTKWVSNDPLFPCNKTDQSIDVQTQCYMMQTSRMLDIYKYDFDQVVLGCNEAPDNMIATCYQSYGRDAAGQVLRNPQKIKALCDKVPSQYYQDCLKGALFVIIEFWGDRMVDQPHGLCKIQTDPQDKEFCYSLLGGRLPQIFGPVQPTINQICAFSESQYIPICLAAASSAAKLTSQF